MLHFVGFQKEGSFLTRGIIYCLDGASQVYLKQPCYAKLESHNSCPETTIHSRPAMCGYGLICDRQCSSTTNDKNLQASLARSTNMAVQTGIAVDFGGMSDDAFFEIHQRPPMLFLGICGHALIMRVGFDARCFHQQGLACGCGEHMVPYAHTDAKICGRSLIEMSGSFSKVLAQEPPVSLLPEATITKFCDDRLRGKNKQKKDGKTSTSTRDLFEKSSFHLLEVFFCHPFINMRAVPFNSQLPSQESLRELVGIINQAAVGLAGMGVTCFLFVASRMLCVNAALNKHMIASFSMGVGLLFLSLSMKRVSDVVISMADNYNRSRKSKEEYFFNLRKELQHVMVNAIPLLVMCFIGIG